MKLWQESMIALARSERITDLAQSQTYLQGLASRFVGGPSTEEAIERARTLQSQGISSSLFFLGEYVKDPAIIGQTVIELNRVLDELAAAGLDINVSVDPTQIGLMIDEAACTANVRRIAEHTAELTATSGPRPGHDALMIDMEDSSVTEYTLRLHQRLASEGLPVAVTVQGYLHRCLDDLARLAASGAWVRLVKGAMAEPSDVAARCRTDVDSLYRRSLATLFSPASLAAGTFPVVASHDHIIIEEAITLATENGWPSDRFGFEMLYGVRPELQRHLVDRGFGVRVYLPFGQDWFPYAIRRVGESPRNLRFALGAVTRG